MQKYRRCLAAFCVVCACAFTEAGFADGPSFTDGDSIEQGAPSVRDAANEAMTIAHVRIVKQTQLYASNKKCGYAYDARVIEPIKGSAKSVRFFAKNEKDFSATDDDYLIFTFSNTASAKAAGLVFEGRDTPACANAPQEFILTHFSSVFAFDLPAKQENGGEWLRRSKRMSFIWCDAPHLPTCKVRWTKIETSRNKPYNVENWIDVKKDIRNNLTVP